MLLLLLLSAAFAASVEPIAPHSVANSGIRLEEGGIDVATAIDGVSGLIQKEEPTGYGEWVVATPCTDSCGACGRTHMFRECLCAGEAGCPCSQPQSRIEVCAKGLCKFPRHSCCKGFKKIKTLHGFECASESAPSLLFNEKPSKKSEVSDDLPTSTLPTTKNRDVVWSEWTVATPCTDTCGACGTTNLTRDCLCAGEEGCPCSERETRVEVCAMGLCVFPRRTCCEGFKKVFAVSGFECRCEITNEKEQITISNAIASPKLVATTEKEPTPISAPNLVTTKRQEPIAISSSASPIHVATKRPEHLSDSPKDFIKNEEDTVWGEWIATTPCTDSCGSCGRTNITRECLCAGKEDCPCSERETREEVCGTKLCQFPRHTCCKGFKKVATGAGFECAAEDSLVHNAPTTIESNSLDKTTTELSIDDSESLDNNVFKDDESVFGDWTVSTPCTSDCGACGVISYSRDCQCAGEEGCPCSDKETRVEVCATELCQFPRHTCCDGFKKTWTVEGFRCTAVVEKKEDQVKKDEKLVSKSSPIPPSLSAASRKFLLKKKAQLEEILLASASPSNCSWGEWIEVNSDCSDSCGMCGVRVSARRHCQPNGCNCVGASTRYEDCGEGICHGREKECCGYYTKSSVNGVRTCVDPKAAV